MISEKDLIMRKAFINKFINAYLISSGFFGIFFISSGYLLSNSSPGLYNMIDLIFFLLYCIMLYIAIRSWVLKKINFTTWILLFLQLVVFNIFGVSYLFSGVIDIIITIGINPFFEIGIEFETGIRYKLLFHNDTGELIIGFNLIAVLYIVILYLHERK